MLHDTVEDSSVRNPDIEEAFGPKIAQLVEGVTKVSGVWTGGEADTESLHKLVGAFAEDPRVLVIKLADRLHNLRSLDALAGSRQRAIADETLKVFAPLAERLGMRELGEELEDLSFRSLNPAARKGIIALLGKTETRRTHTHLCDSIREALCAGGLADAEVTGRLKRPYSLWRKSLRKSLITEDTADISEKNRAILLREIGDLSAFRVIVEEVADCYRALGILHRSWPMVPDRFKDHISVPKDTGYQSLHTTLVMPGTARPGSGPPNSIRAEVQIRTTAMHELAESGEAAHWRYKNGAAIRDHDPGKPFQPFREWIRGIQDSIHPEDTLASETLARLGERVYCFTPNRRIVHLAPGATVLDFAYAVHTEIGNSCIGAVVDGETVPPGKLLKSGQQVEILRSSRAVPQEEDAHLPRAKREVRRAIRMRDARNARIRGRRAARNAMRLNDLPLSDRNFSLAASRLRFRSAEQLFESIGNEKTRPEDLIQALRPTPPEGRSEGYRRPKRSFGEVLRGNPARSNIVMGECCLPLPGERVVGIAERGSIVTVHEIGCRELSRHEEGSAGWFDMHWHHGNARSDNRTFVLVEIENYRGANVLVCEAISSLEANVEEMKFVESHPDRRIARLELGVRSAAHLKRILDQLNSLPVVRTAHRSPSRGTHAEFFDSGSLRRGHFVLASGLHSPTYLQCAVALMDPARAERLCGALAARIRANLLRIGTQIDYCVSPAMGGVIVGYETARHLGVVSKFAERVAGKFVFRRGFDIPEGSRTVVIEDVITTGGSAQECIAAVRAAGAEVALAASLVDRSGGETVLDVPLVSLLVLDAPTYEADNLPEALATIPVESPGSKRLSG